MSAELYLWQPGQEGVPEGKLIYRVENAINTPIVGHAWRGNGQAIAGEYLLEFTNTGGVITVDVTAVGGGASAKNPYHASGLPFAADGATWNDDVVPGIRLKGSASIDTGWAAVVTVDNYMDGSANVTKVLEFEVVTADGESSGRRIAVRNTGDETASGPGAAGVIVYALPGFHYVGVGAEEFISRIEPHSKPERHKLASPAVKVITFAGWEDDPGGKKRADILVDGEVCVTDALFDGLTDYQWGVAGYNDAEDLLEGLLIRLPDTTADPTGSSITLTITEGWQWVELAEDIAGSPGEYSVQDLDVGDIAASSQAYLWVRSAVPAAAAPGLMRKANILPRGLSI